ncbi:MAG TPA: hypothetical protein VE631_08520 [Alphaproteobacteria bacterium]|jgi:hypothetical protein|nr:hypothetical protein [Alphaproteobacteria bacterium]
MQGVDDSARDLAASALAALEAACAEPVPGVDAKVAEAVGLLLRLRDRLIDGRRAGENCGDWLERVNAALSAAFGVEFPVAGIQWDRACEARDSLRALLEAPSPDDPGPS